MKPFCVVGIGIAVACQSVWAQDHKPQRAANPAPAATTVVAPPTVASEMPAERPEYRLGVADILDITILQPERMAITATVGPDGSISFPFIGSVLVKDLTTTQIEEEIRKRLADGYMKYPVVSVSLKESRSQKFFVYGEVTHPGAYPIEERATVLKAISIAGGFTKFGSSSRVKVLRPRSDKPGYENIVVNMKTILEGNSQQDPLLQSGDIIIVSEGVF